MISGVKSAALGKERFLGAAFALDDFAVADDLGLVVLARTGAMIERGDLDVEHDWVLRDGEVTGA